MAVFLVGVCLIGGSWFLRKTGTIKQTGVLGSQSPSLVSSAEGAELGEVAIIASGNDPTPPLSNSTDEEDPASVSSPQPNDAVADGALQDTGTAVGPSFDQSGATTYVVRAGDTLSGIATSFGISVATILNANPSLKNGVLRAGEQLEILPTTNVVYETKTGDTLQSISDMFGIAESTLLKYNSSVDFDNLASDSHVIIPGGTEAALEKTSSAGLPNFDHEFIMPAAGHNWGVLHSNNGVDIANSCGTPVVASADGLVMPDNTNPDTPGGWNNGYGNFVLLQHSFSSGVMTRYSHLESVSVQVGDYVKQGETIGLMGETGDATDCDLRFEVLGAHNPFAKS